jgi:hypothetical protein
MASKDVVKLSRVILMMSRLCGIENDAVCDDFQGFKPLGMQVEERDRRWEGPRTGPLCKASLSRTFI